MFINLFSHHPNPRLSFGGFAAIPLETKEQLLCLA